MNEGLGSLGLKDAKFNKGKAQLVLSTPPAGPTPKKVSLVKRNRGPLVKRAFRLKPTSKWVKKARVGEAHLKGFDPVVN